MDIRAEVKKLMLANVASGYSPHLKHNFCYIKPSPGTYPFQWFWDTCFHVYILCALEEYELAKRNMISLFAMQEDDGFVGHMIFWQRTIPLHLFDTLQAKPSWRQIRSHMSALIQPPLVAQAVLRIYEDTRDKDFLHLMLPKIKKYHEWLVKNRDIHGDGLISIISPFESGMDYKPSYDRVVGFRGKGDWILGIKNRWIDLRNFLNGYNLGKIFRACYFQVKDVGFNSIYALDLRALTDLCEAAGDEQGSAVYRRRAQKVGQSILSLMYDQNSSAFYDVYGPDNKKSKVLTFTTFFPIVLPEVPIKIAEQVIRMHMNNEKEFGLPYPIASVAKSEPAFDPYESPWLWRGPTWIVANWFLYRCLVVKNFKKEAERLRQTILKLIEKSGFREYYNPFTGEGYGARDFTWSGLIVDIMD